MNKAIFIDKDGTLIENIPYDVNHGLITFEMYAFEALRLLQKCGFLLVIVSNQAGVALGYFTEEEVEQQGVEIKNRLLEKGIILDGFYYCPHHPKGKVKSYSVQCDCRKPAPGMLLKAALELEIDVKSSWMVGDILHDVEAGNQLGCKTILIDNGNETEWILNDKRTPDYTVTDLKKAAELICSERIDMVLLANMD